MKVNFTVTDDQKKVVFAGNKNILVSAAAGSGKTRVLIYRACYLIAEKNIPVKRLLIVTFTKAAASEMKSRLVAELAKIENKTDFIKEQLSDIGASNISTLHSFCAKMLKTYFYEIGLDPSFILLDEIESNAYKEKSYKKLVDMCYAENDNNFFELLDIFSQNRKDENFKNIIFDLYNFLSTQVDADGWKENKSRDMYCEDLENNMAVRFIVDYFDNKFKRLSSDISKIKDNANAICDTKLIGYLESLSSVVDNYLNLGLKEKLNISNLSFLIKMPPNKDTENAFIYDEAKAIKKEFTKIVDEHSKLIESDDIDVIKSNIKTSKLRIEKLYHYIDVFNDYYTALKNEKIALDFNDLEHYTIKLLSDERVRKVIKDSFDYVFVDEYQDTNYVQEKILSLISKPNNLFMVGDVKQSIYKFRESEPQIFIDKYNNYKENKMNGEVFDLKDNFRSHKDILGFTNQIFKHVMTDDFGKIDYEHAAMLVSKNDGISTSTDGLPAVSVSVIKKIKEEKNEEKERTVYSVKNHDEFDTKERPGTIEGKIVADKIKTLMGKLIYDSDKKGLRRLKYSDIVILSSARDEHLKDLLDELKRHGIPFNSDATFDVFDDPNIVVIKSLLEVLDNPRQDLPLISLMQSRLFDFSFEELAQIRIAANNARYFFEAVDEACQKDNFDVKIKQKINKMKTFINKFREKSKYLEVDNLIIDFIKQTNYEAIMLSEKDGDKSIIKLRKLLNIINGKSYNRSLARFLDNLKDGEILIDAGGDKDSVNVTTIHKSKGLEYPVVFLVNAGKSLIRPDSNEMTHSSQFGVTMNSYDVVNRTKSTNIVRSASLITKKTSILEERARLLYVALTRAVNHLFIIGTEDVDKKLASPDEAKTFLDWIRYAVCDKELGKLDGDLDFEYIEYRSDSFKTEDADNNDHKLVFGKGNPKIVNELKRILNYKYPHTDSNKLSKTTVSELLTQDSEPVYTDERFILSGDEAVKRGKAFHRVMQLINLNLTDREEIELELKDLIQNGKLTREELESVNLDDVIKLLTNKEFRNIISSGNILREQEFIATENNTGDIRNSTLIQGIVDLIVIKDKSIVIIDYKTNNSKDENFYIDKYKKQLDIYAYAIGEAYDIRDVKKYIYSTKLAKLIEV